MIAFVHVDHVQNEFHIRIGLDFIWRLIKLRCVKTKLPDFIGGLGIANITFALTKHDQHKFIRIQLWRNPASGFEKIFITVNTAIVRARKQLGTGIAMLIIIAGNLFIVSDIEVHAYLSLFNQKCR